MRQRVIGIAAIFILVLAFPFSPACSVVARAAMLHNACCGHRLMGDACCDSPSHLGCAPQIAVGSASYSVQRIAPLVSPPQIATLFADHRLRKFEPRALAPSLPQQYPPPGLLLAETIVLRI